MVCGAFLWLKTGNREDKAEKAKPGRQNQEGRADEDKLS